MSFYDLESSLDAGRPIRLYLFEHGPTHYGVTNADRDIDFQQRSYKAAAISDDGIRQTGEAAADTLTLTCPDDLDPAERFRIHPPSGEIWLTIRDAHFGLPDAADSALIVWIGTLEAVRRTAPGAAELICQPLSASMNRNALRLSYERNCPHVVFDRRCGLSRALYRREATVLQKDGLRVEVSDVDEAFSLSGGMLEWTTTEGITERRAVERQTGRVLTLLSGTAGLSVGQTVALYPGCAQTRAMCQSLFQNLDNFGGFPHMPGKSPFENNQFF